MIKPDLIETIQNESIELKRKGRYFWTLCPFHAEKNPSFTVNPLKQTFNCYGCGERGDAITFIQKHRNLSFKEAIKYLNCDKPKSYNREIRKRELVKAFHKWCNNRYNDLCLCYRTLQKLKTAVKTMEEVELLAELYHKEPHWLW